MQKSAGISPENVFVFANTGASKDHVFGWQAIEYETVIMGQELERPDLLIADKFRDRMSTLFALLDVRQSQRETFYRHKQTCHSSKWKIRGQQSDPPGGQQSDPPGGQQSDPLGSQQRAADVFPEKRVAAPKMRRYFRWDATATELVKEYFHKNFTDGLNFKNSLPGKSFTCRVSERVSHSGGVH
ncbi:hypothetical protein ElyMa_006817000 [Elysia marginata]|uniref:Uncharacterized protein n=1 Tax=Elysia marginata TaxID=1093978 RepID=A0AAV4J390_9GAST|nr:hypothetical protein ElyMa_006817000 [Elysia marginata]